MANIALLLLSTIPHDYVLREHVSLVEVNAFYDENGRLVFEQDIFYDWSWKSQRYDVVAWRLVKQPSMRPQRDFVNGGWSVMWQDGDMTRRVSADSLRETWTQYDTELLEREILPKEARRELRQPPSVVKRHKSLEITECH